MTAPERIHLVVPAGFDDPARPSGGNTYDRSLLAALRSLGHHVPVHPVPGAWPAGSRSADALGGVLTTVPDGDVVLVDGLVGLGAADALEAHRHRLRQWLLVHLPLTLAPGATARTVAQEQRALVAVSGVVTTSRWTREWLLATYPLDPDRVQTAPPGAEPVGLAATRTSRGHRLLVVGAVVPAKGHDVLVAGLAGLTDLWWSCRVVGPLDRAPAFVGWLRRDLEAAALTGRVRLEGALAPSATAAAYDAADLVVVPTRLETYGLVVTEALARGIPVVASAVGGVPEALGNAPGGRPPGALVRPGSPTALGAALRRWLTDGTWREELRAAARARRTRLPDWSTTALAVASAVSGPAHDAPTPARSR
jgi:glycosyltransferase involved in cell wall biosynthesis